MPSHDDVIHGGKKEEKKRITGGVLLVLCLIRHMTASIGSLESPSLCYCLLRCLFTAAAHLLTTLCSLPMHAPAMHAYVTDWLLCM